VADLLVFQQQVDKLRHLQTVDGYLRLIGWSDDQVLLGARYAFDVPDRRAVDRGAGNGRTSHLRLHQPDVSQIGTCKIRPVKVGLPHVNRAEIGIAEVRVFQVDTPHISSKQIRAMQVSLSQPVVAQVGPGEVRSCVRVIPSPLVPGPNPNTEDAAKFNALFFGVGHS